MKKELLCPVGSIDAAHAAIHNGADAIYLGGKQFGARAFAENFSDEEIINVINDAHLYGVKVYVTVNTLIGDTDFNEALNFIDLLHKNGVDAVILQDIGFSIKVRKMYPNLELHASTQMHNLDSFSALFLKNLGFKRIVVARELTLEEINKIDTDLEIEVFIHGAICMSYSGQCLLSSMAMNRSGNKGACSQLCRMPYNFYINEEIVPKTGKYLLSPKDLNTTSIFTDIMNSNITSLKIEGRMKSKEYVAVVTKMYRKLIDGFYNKETIDVSNEEKALEQLFNRGYGTGHLISSDNLINSHRGNHKGIKIGEVINITENNITIKLTDSLYVGDGIKFDKSDKGTSVFNIYKNREIIKEGLPGDVINIPNKVKLEGNDIVLKTVDVRLNKSLENYEEKKIPVTINITAKKGKNLIFEVICSDDYIKREGPLVDDALNKEVTLEDIKEKVTKLGGTAFIASNVEIIKDDNIFIPLSSINNLRREIFDNLTEIRKNGNINYRKEDINDNFNDINQDEELSIYVRTSEQLDLIKKYPIKRIYTSNYELYEKNKDLNIYYEVNINEDKEFKNGKLLINSTSDLLKYKDNDLVLNYSMNVYNSNTLNYYKDYGITNYSAELKLDELKKFNRKIIGAGELLIYGKVKVMTMKHCLLYNKPICESCKYKDSKRFLEDSFDRKYNVVCHDGVNYLYDHKDILKIRDLKELKFIGIKRFRIDLFNENEKQINNIMNEYFSNNH